MNQIDDFTGDINYFIHDDTLEPSGEEGVFLDRGQGFGLRRLVTEGYIPA